MNCIDGREVPKMPPNVHGKLRIHIFVEERNDGMVWVPYKTLVGYGVETRVIIGSRGEQLYTDQEYSSRQAAVDAAKGRASEIIHAKFGEDREIRWDVVEEGKEVPALING
jgi:hypothetical protein